MFGYRTFMQWIICFIIFTLMLSGLAGCGDSVFASASKTLALNQSEQEENNNPTKKVVKDNQTIKEDRIKKEKQFEAGLSLDEVKVMLSITPNKVSTSYETHTINPSFYYSDSTESFEYVTGKSWQSVDRSVVTFYVTNHLKYTNIDSLNVRIIGKTLKREDERYIWPVTSDSKTATIIDLRPGESRKITVHFETEVKLKSKGGAISDFGAGLSNAFAKAGKAAGKKGFRVAMNPASIQFDKLKVKAQYIGDIDEKLIKIIDEAKNYFVKIRGKQTHENADGDNRWDSIITLPLTTDNKIWYWKKYGYHEFRAKIVETDSTFDGRKKTNEFIKFIEQSIETGWEKEKVPSDLWDIQVVFRREDLKVEVISQHYKTIGHYESHLQISCK
jgi:hypothetical protein